MTVHPDDVAAGLAVTIRRERTRQRGPSSQELDHYHSLEPGTVTDVERSPAGRVRAICARNEATRRAFWFTARIVEGTGQQPAPVIGYFRRGSSVTSGYELLFEPFRAFPDVVSAR